MKHRTITASLSIIIICFMAFIIPFIKASSFSYASVNDDSIYVPLRDPSDAVIAFQAYCKSRDLTIEGSLTDAVTTFTTGAFNSACNEIGINISQLQAEIKAEYDQTGKPVKFFFNDTGVMAMNRIFAQFLQDNELSVGDTDINKNVKSGRYFIDDQGNGCFVYINDTSHVSVGNNIVPSELGTVYIHDSNFFESNTDTFSETYSFHEYQYTFNYKYETTSVYKQTTMSTDNRPTTYMTMYYYRFSDHSTDKSDMAVIFSSADSSLWVGRYTFMSGSSNASRCTLMKKIIIPNDEQVQNVVPITNIYIISNEINNNNYEGDTYITNEGDIINEGDTNIYNPYPDGGGTITGPSSGNGGGGTDGTITFPDIDLTLPEINWSIGDLSNKFPFSIPFDLIAFFTVLNAPAEAPAIDADIPLGDWYTWHFEADFSQFDNYAEIIRNVEFIAFCIALIYLTIRLVKG